MKTKKERAEPFESYGGRVFNFLNYKVREKREIRENIPFFLLRKILFRENLEKRKKNQRSVEKYMYVSLCKLCDTKLHIFILDGVPFLMT